MVYYTDENLPIQVLTNNTYKDSINFAEKGIQPHQNLFKSLERFVKASGMVKKYDPNTSKSAIDYTFNILKTVGFCEYEEYGGEKIKPLIATEWSIVYDITNLKIYFRTFENQKIRFIDMQSFDFSCASPVKVMDIHLKELGDVSNNFTDYSTAINSNFLKSAYKEFRTGEFSEAELDKFLLYLESSFCGQ